MDQQRALSKEARTSRPHVLISPPGHLKTVISRTLYTRSYFYESRFHSYSLSIIRPVSCFLQGSIVLSLIANLTLISQVQLGVDPTSQSRENIPTTDIVLQQNSIISTKSNNVETTCYPPSNLKFSKSMVFKPRAIARAL